MTLPLRLQLMQLGVTEYRFERGLRLLPARGDGRDWRDAWLAFAEFCEVAQGVGFDLRPLRLADRPGRCGDRETPEGLDEQDGLDRDAVFGLFARSCAALRLVEVAKQGAQGLAGGLGGAFGGEGELAGEVLGFVEYVSRLGFDLFALGAADAPARRRAGEGGIGVRQGHEFEHGAHFKLVPRDRWSHFLSSVVWNGAARWGLPAAGSSGAVA